MKVLKQLLVALVTVCMAMGSVPALAVAEGEQDSTDTLQEQASVQTEELPSDVAASLEQLAPAEESPADDEVADETPDEGDPLDFEEGDPTDQLAPVDPEADAPKGDVEPEGEAEAAAPALTGQAHVQNRGWVGLGRGEAGSVRLGTTGRSLRLEAFRLSVAGGSLSYRAHVQSEGWQGWREGGAAAGSVGRSRRVEAVRIRLSDELSAAGWSVQYRAHVQNVGWMGWAADGELAGTAGLSLRVEALDVRVVRAGEPLPQGGAAYRDSGLSVSAHVQNLGWRAAARGYSVTAGTTGRSLRLEALRVSRPPSDLTGDVECRAHVQDEGWQGWRAGGRVVGSVGRSRRVEAIAVRLTGELADAYDVWYRLHVQNAGWMGWAHDGEQAGTAGMSLRVEAVQIALVPEGSAAPSSSGQSVSAAFVDGTSGSIEYEVSTDASSWSGWAANGGMAGVANGAAVKRLRAHVSGEVAGQVSYAVHLSGLGWQRSVANDGAAGTGNRNVEAIRMSLSGDAAKFFDVWYRTYVQGVGWMGWARSGDVSGSTGNALPIVAMEAKLVSKTGGAPSNTDASAGTSSFIGAVGQLAKDANARQRRIVQAAQGTPWPGPGLCAAWVEDVYRNAGFGTHSGNACDLYDRYCKSSNLGQLKVGMIVAVRTHSRTSAGSIWGHVGIYIGDGWVMHSVTNNVTKMRLQDWMNYYGTTYTPKWGWLGNAARRSAATGRGEEKGE